MFVKIIALKIVLISQPVACAKVKKKKNILQNYFVKKC